MWCDAVVLDADHAHLEPDGFCFALRWRSGHISAHTIVASMVAGLHGGSVETGKADYMVAVAVWCVVCNEHDLRIQPSPQAIDQLFGTAVRVYISFGQLFSG